MEAVYNRIPSLNYVYRPYDGWKGVSNKWLRGFNINHSVTIVRTPSTFVFDIAGYTYPHALYAGLSYQHADVGNLRLSTSGTAKTMFAEAFDEPKPFPLRIKYGSYRITDISGTGVQAVNTPIVPAYKTVISFRKGVRIISKSLSTKAGAEYSILYSVSDTLNVRRLADYTSTSTTLSEFTANGEAAGAFTMTALKTGASNHIGNVLNIRYLGNGDIPNLTCFLTIAPAFLKFQAVDHTTTGAQAITSIPFTKHADQLLTQYKAVSHSAYEEGVAVSQSWNPYAGSDVNIINVNNMTISAIAKTFEQYRTSAGATHALNVDPHKLTIEYASGYGSAVGDFGSSPVFDDIIPLTDFTDSKVKLESDFDGEGTLKISLHQKNITTNGAMPTVIFDETDSYNLVIELGSHLLTPIEGAFTTDLEFSAGDCTGLTTYCIDSIYTTATDFKVKIARYSNASGVNSDLFNASISGGIAVGGSVKETIELSTPLTEEPGDLLTVSDLLTNIKDNMASVARPGWATVTDYNANSKVVWLKPTSAGGKTDLRTALLLSKYVPRSVTIFELDDAHRLMDNQGVAVLRVASQGKVYRNTTSATSDVGALLHLANALAL